MAKICLGSSLIGEKDGPRSRHACGSRQNCLHFRPVAAQKRIPIVHLQEKISLQLAMIGVGKDAAGFVGPVDGQQARSKVGISN